MTRTTFNIEVEGHDAPVEVEVEGTYYPGSRTTWASPGEPGCWEIDTVRIDGVDLNTQGSEAVAGFFRQHEDHCIEALTEAFDEDRDDARIAEFEDRYHADYRE